ncbi:MAG TPA: patatin-like phospholipase family protein [Sphingobium sp.]|nr:patatin-like phospholipase family protein [Sphingobium sp.]
MEFSLALVLSGGNALGAYQAGAYEAICDHGLEPDWVAGASAGAINGAIICGNPTDQRIPALRSLWKPASDAPQTHAWPLLEKARRTAAAAWTLSTGRLDLFMPRHLLGPWWNPSGSAEPSSLYDATPLRNTVERLVDFNLLNRGTPRFSATAVDIETGDDVVFDTRMQCVEPDHLRASSALLPVFPPIDIDGRLFGDAGISSNLPLDVVLSEVSQQPLLCIAIDLLPLRAPKPNTLGDTAARMQDLIFATQSRRAIAAWQAIFDERAHRGDAASVTIMHIVYAAQSEEVSGKGFDFSSRSAGMRWQAGYVDMAKALAVLQEGKLSIGEPGLALYTRNETGPVERVRWAISPHQG